MDEVNEYFFEATSKIPIAEIQKASKEKEKAKEKENKVISPYTIDDKPKSKVIPVIVTLIIILLVFLISYIVITEYISPKQEDNNDVITLLEN